ncbi:hypothetical protein [Anaerovorax sp. IOR16]|uniref:hypothetical protein n=1 Tax=Anaerovorax sp. IOR16 TaxID=2773458 RepID=UPI0019D0D835|nr:hypothetical protein [Anaerovorax sp. IOR16]
MMAKSEAIHYLANKLSSIYCNTCVHQISARKCETCHRKNMNYGLSHTEAATIINKIYGKG